MFRSLLFETSMWWWGWIPLLLVVAILALQLVIWWRATGTLAAAKSFDYEPETFRNPINAALTVSGIVLPLLCTAIGTLAAQSATPRQLLPLVASTAFFGLSVMVGLWNAFSMTAFTGNTVNISRQNAWTFVPIFVAQLSFMFAGIAVLLCYLLFAFELPRPEANRVADTPSPAAHAVAPSPGMPMQPGQSAADVRSQWGAPVSTQMTAAGEEWHYRSENAEITLLIRDGQLIRITQNLLQP